MSTDLAQNKVASASSYVKPFAPARAVDGNWKPESRWLCNELPGWMGIDLGAAYYVDRWVVVHMGASGWDGRYNTRDYCLKGSLDNQRWTTLDSIANNADAKTDRRFPAAQVRYIRVEVTKGLAINPQLASIVDLQIYEAANTYLSDITLSAGTLIPEFDRNITQYSAAVSGVGSITVTPFAEVPNARITVNGLSVQSGQSSPNIGLNPGSNMIIVASTASDGLSQINYSIDVTRADANADLTKVDVAYKGRSGTVTYSIDMVESDTEYVVDLPDTVNSITVKPYSKDPNATILVNNSQTLANGQVSAPISVSKYTRIPLRVSVNGGSIVKEYGITIE